MPIEAQTDPGIGRYGTMKKNADRAKRSAALKKFVYSKKQAHLPTTGDQPVLYFLCRIEGNASNIQRGVVSLVGRLGDSPHSTRITDDPHKGSAVQKFFHRRGVGPLAQGADDGFSGNQDLLSVPARLQRPATWP